MTRVITAYVNEHKEKFWCYFGQLILNKNAGALGELAKGKLKSNRLLQLRFSAIFICCLGVATSIEATL